MKLEKDITKVKHRTWGEGIFKGIIGSVLNVEFPTHGLKRLGVESIQNGILSIIDDGDKKKTPVVEDSVNDEGNLRQYDSSDTIIGGKNILKSFDSNDVVIFNESYILVGEECVAKKISATYDLTVIGDIDTDELNINGDLVVVGNIYAKKLVCENTFVCHGDVDVDEIYIGEDIIANSVKCKNFVCDGNAVIKTTIDIDESCKTEKTMVACEGIMGAGEFSALNAIANEYFEFSGDINGNIVELESDTTFSEITKEDSEPAELSLSELFSAIERCLIDEYQRCRVLDEDAVLTVLNDIKQEALGDVVEYPLLFSELTRISYQDQIDDFGDYLTVVYAKKILPTEIYRYETLDHIETMLLPKAHMNVEEMEFVPGSVEKIARCIKYVDVCECDLTIDKDDALDKIFSSFGLKFNTVKSIVKRYSNEKMPIVEPEKKKVVIVQSNEQNFDQDLTNHIHIKQTKTEFLNSTVQKKTGRFGLTDDEKMRLASAGIKTCGEFLDMSEDALKGVFGKKVFLANHLIGVQKKMRLSVELLED